MHSWDVYNWNIYSWSTECQHNFVQYQTAKNRLRKVAVSSGNDKICSLINEEFGTALRYKTHQIRNSTKTHLKARSLISTENFWKIYWRNFQQF